MGRKGAEVDGGGPEKEEVEHRTESSEWEEEAEEEMEREGRKSVEGCDAKGWGKSGERRGGPEDGGWGRD